MRQLVCVIDGFALPSTVRGWTRWSDGSIDPISIDFCRGEACLARGAPDHARVDIVNNPAFKAGFQIDLGSYELLQEVVLGTVTAIARFDETETATAMVWSHARTMMLAQLVSDGLAGNSMTSLLVFTQFAKNLSEDDPIKAPLKRLIASVKNATGASVATGTETERSAIGLPVGMRSADASSILGRDGQLFLVDGSNSLIKRYDRTPENDRFEEDLAVGWRALFETRKAALVTDTRSFLHFIVPEKNSALADLFPIEISAPTGCLRKLEADLADDPCYLSVMDVIRSVGPARFHRPTDTHPSAEGQFGLLRAILRRIGFEEALDALDVRFDDERITSGDLAERFFGVPILEASRWPSSVALDRLVPVYNRTKDSKSGRTNTVTVARCDRAPIDRTVVVFGNSVFNHGSLPFEQSWWFTRLFRNVHFAWSNVVDLAYVDEIQPDLVIAQTVERFLVSGAPAN